MCVVLLVHVTLLMCMSLLMCVDIEVVCWPSSGMMSIDTSALLNCVCVFALLMRVGLVNVCGLVDVCRTN